MDFKCTQCAGCCTGPHLLTLPEGTLEHYGLALGENGDCINLAEDKSCKIYKDRPMLCRVEEAYDTRDSMPDQNEQAIYNRMPTKAHYFKWIHLGCNKTQERQKIGKEYRIDVDKELELDLAREEAEDLAECFGKIGFVASCFDLLHAGHCLMLEDAKAQCDWLVAALQVDPSVDRPDKMEPVQTLLERRIQLESCAWVDEIVIYETEQDLIGVLKEVCPDVRILGSDYDGKDFTGKDLDIEIYYHRRDHDWSTSSLRKKLTNQK